MAIVINGSGTVTGLAVGGLPDGTVDSGTLATDSVTAAKIPASLENTFVSGRKNLIINGDFSVNQRGTAATTGGTYLTADRFKAGATNVTFQTVANDRDLSISNMLKVTSHTNGYGVIVQPIEDVHTASGKNITLSFWAKTSDFSSFRLEMSQNFGSGGSTAVEILNNTTYFSVPDSNWNQYTATIAIPSISGKTIGTGSHLNIVFGSNSGTSGGIAYYSEVQVELGSTATDFEHRSYGEELALCKRYFHKLGGGANKSICSAWAPSTAEIAMQVYLPAEMRTTPSVSWFNTGASMAFRYCGNNSTAFTPSSCASLTLNELTENGGSIWFGGFSHGQANNGVGEIRCGSGVTNYLEFDSEL